MEASQRNMCLRGKLLIEALLFGGLEVALVKSPVSVPHLLSRDGYTLQCLEGCGPVAGSRGVYPGSFPVWDLGSEMSTARRKAFGKGLC